MNKFDILGIILSCISSIGNSAILLKISEYNSELKELNVVMACAFAICNIYTIYNHRKVIESDDLDYFNPSGEPAECPNDDFSSHHIIVPSSSFFVDEED